MATGMSGRFALLCPGQGHQHAGMFDLLPAARRDALFEEWQLATVLGMPVAQALDDKHRYVNRIAQPLIVASALAQWELLRDRLPRPHLIVGYSAGELSAHGIAHAAAPAAIIGLAAQRASLMDLCAKHRPQGLMAVTGARTERLHAMLAGTGLHVAIATGEDSAIVGGLNDDLERLAIQLERQHVRTQRLPVAVASHTPWMRPAAQALAPLLETSLQAPRLPVLAGISAQTVTTKNDAVDTLARQTAEPIRWAECMDACAEAGVTTVLELGPGAALSRMLRARHPHIACRSMEDFRSLDGIQTWLARQA